MLQTAASCDVCIALQQCSAGRNHGRPFNKLPQKWPWFLQMYRETLLNSSYRSCSTLSLLFPLKIIAFATFWTTSIEEVPLTTLFNFRCENNEIQSWEWPFHFQCEAHQTPYTSLVQHLCVDQELIVHIGLSSLHVMFPLVSGP